MILSIDIGGTFTDFVLLNEQGLRTHKTFSTLNSPEEAILNGIDALELHRALQSDDVVIAHNSSVDINVILKNKNIKTIYVADHKLAAARFFSALIQQPLLTLNIGNTSTSASLIENNVILTNETPIGVGGSSIAYVDQQPLLQLSSSTPEVGHNPACYGLGDDQPTITDANLILGRIRPNIIFGNTKRPDVNSARMALAKLSGPLKMRIEDVALAIINITNKKIIAALQLMLDKHDHSQLTLCASGGCGGLHVCAVADALNIKNVIVPLFSGVFSAFGLLVAAAPNVSLTALHSKKDRASHQRIQLYGITLPVSVWNRDELSPEEMIMGPAIIMEETTTTFLQNGWLAYVDGVGNLLLRRMAIDVY